MLVESHASGLYRLAYGRLGNRQDAEDVVQDSFVKAYRAQSSFKEGTNVEAWLTTILINTIRDHVRRVTRTPSVLSIEEAKESGVQLPDRQTAGVEQALIDSELDPELQAALQSLPDTFLTPVLLRDVHDLTYQEIAGVLDIPMGTVMSRLSRGRQMLRDRLKNSQCAELFQGEKRTKDKDAEHKGVLES
jgi:RNA polymerase sigma-70 factor (ECF subfamily)